MARSWSLADALDQVPVPKSTSKARRLSELHEPLDLGILGSGLGEDKLCLLGPKQSDTSVPPSLSTDHGAVAFIRGN